MNSYVDVNLDGSGVNGTEQSGGGSAQKYVTFDDDIAPSYDQPFSAPKVAPTVPDYSRQQQQQQQQQYPPRQQQQQQQYPSQQQRISGLVSQNSNPDSSTEEELEDSESEISSESDGTNIHEDRPIQREQSDMSEFREPVTNPKFTEAVLTLKRNRFSPKRPPPPLTTQTSPTILSPSKSPPASRTRFHSSPGPHTESISPLVISPRFASTQTISPPGPHSDTAQSNSLPAQTSHASHCTCCASHIAAEEKDQRAARAAERDVERAALVAELDLEFQHRMKEKNEEWFEEVKEGDCVHNHMTHEIRFLCIAVESPKLETIRKWTVQHYKMTKQIVNEKMGNSTKTVDKELEDRIEDLRTSKIQYTVLLKEARAMYSRFESLLASHRNMRSNFQSLIAHVPALQDQLQANATTQSILEKNGEGLLGALRTFVDGLHTLVNVTMQDTFLTIKNYENSRIEYDAYRNEIDAAQSATQTDANRNKLLELQVMFESRKLKWEKLKSDTHIKLNLLQENKLMVMKQQLEMFNSAVIAYFSGNGEVLSEVLSEYHIKSKALSDEGDSTTKSFLAKD